MLADIASAQRDICFEMYIWEADEDGRAFQQAMIRQARAGRWVRVVYDAIGCIDTPAQFFEEMREAGVEVVAFNPLRGRRLRQRLPSLDRRNHRKVLVVDDRVAWLGGINVASRLADSEDAQIRMEGRIARAVRISFERVWAQHYRGIVLRRPPRGAPQRQRYLILDGFPVPNYSPIKRAHLHLFSRARRRVRILHAYFVPDRKTIRVLRRAVRRGAAVQVIVPLRSDVGAVDWALAHVLGRLLRSQVEVRMHAEPMLHSKVCVTDDRYAIIGSANLNRTSLFRNLEIALWTRDERVVRPLVDRFEYLWERARPYTLDEHRRRGRARRFLSWLAYRLLFWLPANQTW